MVEDILLKFQVRSDGLESTNSEAMVQVQRGKFRE